MPLNRSQLIAGDAGQGTVLAGQVQGVIPGTGITIAPNGTISLDTSGAAALGFITTSTPPAPVYSWPVGNGTALCGKAITTTAHDA
jgi:hypothetical protein